jgi:hypothetical protein
MFCVVGAKGLPSLVQVMLYGAVPPIIVRLTEPLLPEQLTVLAVLAAVIFGNAGSVVT